jgi:integrase
LCPAFRSLLEELDLYRPRVTFYALRHSFETIAGDSGDQIATNAVMGHVDNSMAAAYREMIRDGRLVAVSNHVRQWLFEGDEQAGSEPAEQEARTLRIFKQA